MDFAISVHDWIGLHYGKTYSEPSETSKAKVFAKIVLTGFSC